MQRVKEEEYGQCTLYTCMKKNNEICQNSSKTGEVRMRENDGEGESN
jgi:hypothetical protein